MDYLLRKTQGDPRSRLLGNFSVHEFGMLVGTYKHIFADQLRQPTADNNHITNYNLKLQNYFIVNSTIHMISAGMATFFMKALVGGFIDRTTINYLGTKRALYAQILIYGVTFYSIMGRLNGSKRLNVNHLVNPRDSNGEIMMNVVLKYFPQKVNQELYRKLLMDKYEAQILKATHFEQMMGQTTHSPYKLSEEEALVTYMQGNSNSQQQAMPHGQIMPGMQQPFNPMQQQGFNPMQPMPQMGPQNFHRSEQQHVQQLVQQQSNPTVPDRKEEEPANTQSVEQQNQQTKIVDQMRESQQKSPYLNTNPLLTQAPEGGTAAAPQQPTQQIVHQPLYSPPVQEYVSPYHSIQKEIQASNTHGANITAQRQASFDNYYTQNIMPGTAPAPEAPLTYKYQGHYSTIAQQAKKDSS